MTERIDLDELDTEDAGDEAEAPNPGDWFWRGEGNPSDESEPVGEVSAGTASSSDSSGGDDSAADPAANEEAGESSSADSTESANTEADSPSADPSESDRPESGPMPRVPRESDSKPVGIPAESGGAGGGPGTGGSSESANDGTADGSERAGGPSTAREADASGPHGGGVDDMTLAFTYEAATRLADFGLVAADAYDWADWVGIVGRVPAHVVNKFQRDRNVDLDFFNGASTDPGERLARIGPSSMFYAERMVVVGVEGRDEEIAETADWEFIPLSDAAEKAGWDVTETTAE